MSCEHRDDAGAWVLGALPEDEQERFAAHLADCATCRREVAELQMVADTLPLAAVQVAPPPELRDRIMSAVRAETDAVAPTGPYADVAAPEAHAGEAAEPAAAPAAPAGRERPKKPKRERGWWKRPFLSLGPVPAAAAAAVLIALGVAGGVLLSNGTSERTVQAQVATPSAPTARASLTVEGDQATLNVRNFPAPPEGRVYQVWLKRPGRDPDPTNALFDVRDGSATVDVPGGVKGVEQVLVTDEPDGGSPAPTREPVVIAQPA
jgi:anti-sigma factor RsiW